MLVKQSGIQEGWFMNKIVKTIIGNMIRKGEKYKVNMRRCSR